MDHQWADVSYSQDTWTWFSIQLENNLELVCFEYVEDNTKTYLASISLPDGQARHFTNITIKALDESWKSEKTKNVYQLSWQIEIPDQKINLIVKPLIKNQEMVFGAINYWEGPMAVTGSVNGQAVSGQGFLELVGRPSQFLDKKEILKRLRLLKIKL